MDKGWKVGQRTPDVCKSVSGPPKVAILLCTYRGQRYLAEQLDSFTVQTHQRWEVFASDDGSNDDTHAILASYREQWGAQRLSIHRGPAEGFAANFLSLTCNPNIQADYYAYSDQDDVWEADKLQRAVQWLQAVPAHVPALYCSRTRLVNASNHCIGLSPLFSKPPCFSNALIQNIGGGNTMVFNEAARALLRKAGDKVDIVTHDWWAYLVVTGCGGSIFYDSYPSVRYRQHDGNILGMNSSWSARLRRLRMLAHGQLRQWNDQNIKALLSIHKSLTPKNQKILSMFVTGRTQPLLSRITTFQRAGVKRQTLPSNVVLFIAAVFGKV